MSEEQTGRTLCCIIKGHPTASQVRVAESDEVHEFKETVREKLGIGAYADRMILWKVCIMILVAFMGPWLILPKLRNPEPVNPENTLKDRIEKLGNNLREFAIWLSSTENVLECFPDPPASEHVHIIVEILPKSEPMCCPICQNPIQRSVYFLQLRGLSLAIVSR
jgi:hypothetical protein